MTDSKSLKVLLYADGSPHSFSATVYAASLFSSLSNMQLTILHIHESAQGSIEGDYNLLETWSSNPNTDWVEHLIDEDSDQEGSTLKFLQQPIIFFLNKDKMSIVR